jgi:hypothetical protein
LTLSHLISLLHPIKKVIASDGHWPWAFLAHVLAPGAGDYIIGGAELNAAHGFAELLWQLDGRYTAL